MLPSLANKHVYVVCWVAQLCPTLWTTWTVVHQGDSLGKNTGIGCHALPQGIFSIQGSNPGLPNCRRILYHLSHHGSPRVLAWVAYPFSRGNFPPYRFFTSWLCWWFSNQSAGRQVLLSENKECARKHAWCWENNLRRHPILYPADLFLCFSRCMLHSAPPAWNQVSVLTWAVTTVSIPASTISFPHSSLSYPWNRDFHLFPRKEVKMWPHTCLLKNLSYHFLPVQGPSNSLAGNIKSK